MSADLDLYFTTVVDLTREAGEVIKTAWKEKKNVEIKASQVDLVTETDKEVEKLLISSLKKKFPEHRFIGEESTAAGIKSELTDVPTWIIDPVDGTMNFVHGFPYVAVSIALAINKEIVIGIVYNAILDQMFTARLGQGAFCNETKLNVSNQEDISQSLIFFEAGNARDSEKMDNVFTNFMALLPLCHGVRSMGSAALNMCHVASGAADAYFEFGVHCWDIAAGDLIVREAGGVVVDPDGGPLDLMSRRMLCGSSKPLVDSIGKQIKKNLTLERD